MEKSLIALKYYSKEDKKFHVIGHNYEHEEYESIKDFAKAINNDFCGADLSEYKSFDPSINSYENVNRALLPQKVVKDKNKDLVEVRTNVKPRKPFELSVRYEEIADSCYVIFYISDIHLDKKIIKKFYSKVMDKFLINDYVREIAYELQKNKTKILEKLNIQNGDNVINLFLGDISYNFDIYKTFFDEIEKTSLFFENSFVILGNHELWFKNHKRFDDIVYDYWKYFNNKKNITLLENELCLVSRDYLNRDYVSNIDCYSIECLNKSKSESFQNLLSRTVLAIYGSIGFAGLNEEYNYNNGLYQNGIRDRKEEIKRSKKTSKMHSLIKEILPNSNVIFATHMPMKDWSKEDYVKGWYYFSGHTHRNGYIDNDEYHIFEDNQVGYDGTNFTYKFSFISGRIDYFYKYEDGIYEIDRESYLIFNACQGIHINFKTEFDKLYMLKKNNSYLFLMENKGKLLLLSGGARRKLRVYDVNYYYQNMEKYQNQILKGLKAYVDYEKEISRAIQSIGGSGRIHGAIVDIDYFNHLYINPTDSSVSPYYATDIIRKYFYPNLISLLKAKKKSSYNKYVKQINNHEFNNSLIIYKDNRIVEKPKLEKSTEMYKASRIIKSMQFLSSHRIIRNWNDDILHFDEGEKLTNAVKEIEVKEINEC